MAKFFGIVLVNSAFFLILTLSPFCNAQVVHYQTSVVPLPNEDIASSCDYELIVPASTGDVSAVWVIFDRGRDVHDLSSDERSWRLLVGFGSPFCCTDIVRGKRPKIITR